MEVHVGGTLKKLLKMKKMKAEEFAKLMGVSERAVRKMYTKRYLHSELMVKISEVLDHDFVRYLYMPEDLPANPALHDKIKELQDEITQLKKENAMFKKLLKV